MKKYILTILMSALSIFLTLMCCRDVWAGEWQSGGTSSGSGSCSCDRNDSPSCSKACKVGGGKNWRVYKLKGVNCTKGEDAECVKLINKKNSGRDLVANDPTFGTGVTINASKVKKCVKNNASYIAVLGLNGMDNNNSGKNKFYILYNQLGSSNRGFYYDWNLLAENNVVSKKDAFLKKVNGGSIGGTAITNELAKQLKETDKDIKDRNINEIGMFCVWPQKLNKVTLRAYAVDTGGNLLRKNPLDSDEVEYDDEAEVEVEDTIDGLSFLYWSSEQDGSPEIQSEYEGDWAWPWFTVNKLKQDTNIYAVYGKQVMLNGVAEDVNGSGLGGCNPVSVTVWKGESATIKSKACDGYRALGWATTHKGIPSGNASSYTVSSLDNDTTVYIIYEKEPVADCPAEYGISIPSSYTNSGIWGGVSSTATRIKNDSVGNSWQEGPVFAKPGEKVSWAHCYFPGVQTIANIVVNNNTIQKQINPFENKYTIKRGENNVTNWPDRSMGNMVGNPDGRHYVDKEFGIATDMVGDGLTESITTGKPTQVTVLQNRSNFVVNQPLETSSSATVYVPYNFINSIGLTAVDNKTYFYAGESSVIESTIQVGKRKNRLTDGEYATRVDGAKTKLRVCYNDNTVCTDTETKDLGTLNQDGNSKGDSRNEKFGFDVPDLPAGTKVCVRSAVYPKDSYLDYNMNASVYAVNDDNSWNWSNEFCFNVAKRPSIQAWGGNVYSTGAIKTSRSVKQDLYGSNNSKKPYVFGSWGELGVISAGGVSGFASGASLGYKNNDGRAWPSYVGDTDGYALDSDYPGGGFGSSDFCNYSVLTFPNSGCSGALTSGISYSGTNTTKGLKDNKNALENLIDIGGTINKKKSIGDNKLYIDGANDDGYNWISKENNNDLEITGGVLMKDTFKIVAASSNIIISGDIKVGDDVVLENFDQAPKVVLYSKKDIKIGCDVVRLDAILVAEGSVITCASDEGIDSEVYSKQLIVNGAIITSKLKANRTYGAGRGINSIVPAEIVNFDPTLYLWGGAAGNKTENNEKNIVEGNLNVTYINELGPRY